MKKIDYLIVGQGIAGSILAYLLLKAGKKVLVLNQENIPNSSLVAGGIFNPITGKNLDKTWLADTIFPHLKDFYQNLEKELSLKFYHETNLYRPFANEQQKKHFLRLTDEYELDNYIRIEQPGANKYAEINNELGGLYTFWSGWVDVPILLDGIKKMLVAQESYLSQSIDYQDILVEKTEIIYQNISTQHLIFCEGYYAKNNPYFHWIPFNPAKGETLIAKVKDYTIREIINQGFWIIPLDSETCRFGSTYLWDDLNWETSLHSRELIEGKIKTYLRRPFDILRQEAGIRPTTKDRRPFVGQHPLHKNLHIFNGLGTKGVSLAPYFAENLINFLENQKELMPEANIERFYTLYS